MGNILQRSWSKKIHLYLHSHHLNPLSSCLLTLPIFRYGQFLVFFLKQNFQRRDHQQSIRRHCLGIARRVLACAVFKVMPPSFHLDACSGKRSCLAMYAQWAPSDLECLEIVVSTARPGMSEECGLKAQTSAFFLAV